MHVIALLLLVTGCDALFRLSEVPPAGDGSVITDARSGCPLVETFSGSASDLDASWTVTLGTGCTADVRSGELVLDIPANVECYALLSSRRRFSFVNGGSLTARVPRIVGAGAAETYILASADSNDFFYITATNGQLNMFTRVNDVDFDVLKIPYDMVLHAFWRIEVRPDAAGATVVYATSSDMTTWVQQTAAPARLAVSSLEIEIGAGSYDPGGAAHTSQLDDITVCGE